MLDLALQDRKGVDIVYIDFVKAFDSVSPAKLIHRLRNYCIDGFSINQSISLY